MPTIERSTFSTRKLPAAQRAAAWRDSISTLFDVEPSAGGGDGGFNAELTSYLLDERVMFSRCRTSAQRFRREPLRLASDGLDHYLLQTHLEGSQRIRRGGGTSTTEPGDLIVIDLADEHAAETTDFTNLTLVVPRPMLAPHLAAPDSQQGRVLPARDGLTRLATNHLRTLWHTLEDLSPITAQQTIDPTVNLLATALNGSSDAVADGHDAAVASLLGCAQSYIESHLDRNPGVDTLCLWLGVSRATLYRLFAPLGGVRAYIRERRLQRCARILTAPEHVHRSIYEVAVTWGFTSQAHFSRAFRQRFGLTPTEAREYARSSAAHPGRGTPNAAADRAYEHWLSGTLRR